MTTTKFNNIPEILNGEFALTYDGDITDTRLHLDDPRWNWGAKNKTLYKKAQKLIDNIEYKGNGWVVYASYDVSSYEYWMKQQEEPNYIHISIMFDTDSIPSDEVYNIANAIQSAIDSAYDIANEFNYDPSTKKYIL